MERMNTAARFTGEDAGKCNSRLLDKLLFGGLSDIQGCSYRIVELSGRSDEVSR